MGGSAGTLTLTALLYLGLCRGLWDQARAGTLPKPSIWADPGPMVTKGSPVTIWCQASLRADVYYLYKERIYESLPMKTSEDSSDRASFYFASMSSHSSGRYRCAYQRGKSWSQRSDLLALVVTGVYDAPSLSANSALVVASGGNVSLSCSSLWQLGSFHLLKERGADVTQYLEMTFRRERYQAVFLVGPVNTSHGGIYRCYTSHESYPYLWSQPSDPLHLQVTGVYREPSLSAQPGSLLQSGDNLTLQCRSETGFDRFALTKDEELRAPQRLDGQPSPNFTLGPVSSTHGGGRYSCYCGHKLSSTWSAPSAPLDVLITGIYEKPSLSAQPGPSVSWGENVTLQCRSEIWLDTFHLSKEGSLAPPQVLHLQDTAKPYQVKFTLSPVTSAHGGTYRCYGSSSASPYLLSQPSDPLELLVSGPHWYLYVLIGVSVALVLLLGLLGLLLVRHRRRGKGRKPAVSAKASEDRGLHRRSGPAATAQEESLYEVMKDTQPEEDTQLDSQAAVSEDPQDVTYAQLDYLTLTQETSTPPSQPGEPPDEPNVYASLAIR
nr:leukocyte immunoglobulin-like receptor subfamily B member 3 isoform X1 [Mirounga angustirostris]